MASIRKEIVIEACPDDIWAALRDVGAVHKRLAPGFVTNTQLEGDARIVTFGNGFVTREVIIDLDDKARRIAYSAHSERLTHHSAAIQVFGESGGPSKIVWIADLLPNEIAGTISSMMDQGCAAMKQTLERVTAVK
jgi:Polyketide cyclase / dehydrase and lipid transport